MHDTTSGVTFFRHRNLAEWIEAVMSVPQGRAGRLRRHALIGAIDLSDVRGCEDIEVLTAFADLLERASHGRDATSADLVSQLTANRHASLKDAADAQIARLYLSAPQCSDSLEADLELLRGCMDEPRRVV